MPRMSYGWENPNYAAAFIACLLPVAWGLALTALPSKSRLLTALLTFVEILAYIAIVLTYSRGAIIGLLAGLAYFHLVIRKTVTKKYWLGSLGLRIGCLSILLAITGLGSRMAGVLGGDKSAMNRIDLWLGGIEIINMRPLTGWGFNKAGFAFMQWVQDIDSSLVYRGFVNSYLTFASEFGLVALWLVLMACFYPLATSGSIGNGPSSPNLRYPKITLRSCLVVFLVTGIFNTLWHDAFLVALGVLIIVACICIQWFETRRMTSGIKLAVLLSTACVGTLYLASSACAHFGNSCVTVRNDGAIDYRCLGITSASKNTIVLLPDTVTLGNDYGKALRRAWKSASSFGFCIYPHDETPKTCEDRRAVIAFGPRIGEMAAHPGELLVIVNPTIPPPTWCRDIKAKTILVLSAYNNSGFKHAWEACASKNKNMKILPIAEYGNNISSIWGDLFLKCMYEL